MREFAEEFLGKDDALGKSGKATNCETDSPYRELEAGRRTGKVQAMVLGLESTLLAGSQKY